MPFELQAHGQNQAQPYKFDFESIWFEYPEFHHLNCMFMITYRGIYFGQVDEKNRPHGFGSLLIFNLE